MTRKYQHRREIDWMAVQFVIQGDKLELSPDEKKMVVRRVAHRMLTLEEYNAGRWSQSTASKLSVAMLAERLMTTDRSVQRIHAELPKADQRVCPVCREPMWVYDTNQVEPHPDSLFEQCPMSGEFVAPPVRGLAALRPDLFPWLEVAQ